MNIVVLGGGYGGFKLVKRLLVNLRRFDVKVILIDKNEFQTLLTSLPSAISNRKKKIVVFYEETLSGYRNFEFIKGVALQIDIKENVVVLSDGRKVKYDHLVIGIGAEPNDFSIDGVKANSIMFWNHEDLEKYVMKLDDFLSQGKSPKIVIVGAGPLGIELSTETYHFLKRRNFYPNIAIIEAKDRVLPSLSPKFSHSINKYLQKIGINVFFNSCVTKVDNSYVYFNRGNLESKIEFDILLWCSGVKANSFIDQIERNSGILFERGKNGRVLVDDYLRVKGFENIWAIGDVALPESYSDISMLAQFAVQMADSLGNNIINLAKGKELEKLKLTFKGIIVQLSSTKASLYVSKPFELVIPPSIMGVLARKFVDYSYLLSIGAKPRPYEKLTKIFV